MLSDLRERGHVQGNLLLMAQEADLSAVVVAHHLSPVILDVMA